MITSATITKKDGEYVVKPRDENGKRIPSADYFTDSLKDAEDTRRHMLANGQPVKNPLEVATIDAVKTYWLFNGSFSRQSMTGFGMQREAEGKLAILCQVAGALQVGMWIEASGQTLPACVTVALRN